MSTDFSVDRPSHDRRRSARRAKSPISVQLTNSTFTKPLPSHCSTSVSSRITITSLSPESGQRAKASLSPEPSSQLHDITRKVIKTLEGLTGVHLDMEIFGLEEENDAEREKDDDREPERTVDGVHEEEREVAKALLLANGNGVALASSNGNAKAEDKKKIDWEIPRKVLHSSIGFFTIYLYLSNGSAKIVVYTLWSALCFIAPADYLRLTYPGFALVYERYLGFLMRESEKRSTNGVIWYIIGVNFALTFYPLDVATVAILILSWADTAASTIGRLWGGYTPRLPARLPLLPFLPQSLRSKLVLPLAPRKSLAGFLAASLTGACIAFVFWGWVAPIPLRVERGDVTWFWNGGASVSGGLIELSALAVFAGLISGVAEALDLGSLDDNLTLPIISGGCLWAFFKILGAVSGWVRR
ncbi:hypothetical protein BDP27DRAFT_1309393 [Rhodocollybia butyracea]|uniref:Phosphatidate cytidylyltransferase n=1 Tax=Rhodocollybia butyracea TaxID=206335 RepID=A0A9P5UH12_9AGAR|nr:hypothetical protein BDP27DRAFT_1309393 [Rhodocollybia butyracea]